MYVHRSLHMSTFMLRKGNVFTVKKICCRFGHTTRKSRTQDIGINSFKPMEQYPYKTKQVL